LAGAWENAVAAIRIRAKQLSSGFIIRMVDFGTAK
jgi:hypothetical protein